MTMSSITPDTVAQLSLHEWRSSSSNHHHHRARSRLRCIPCGRCHAVIQHDSRAPWSVVNKLVNMHWDACPGKPHVLLAQIPPPLSVSDSSPPSAPLPPPSSIPPPVGGPGSTSQTLSVKKDGDGGREFAGPTRTGPSVTSAGWERKRKTEEQRKKELEEDEYAEHVTAISVVCVGCRKQISLDKRSRYYPGLWVKHKNKCPDVDRLKRATSRCGESEQIPDGDQSFAWPPSTVSSTPSARSATYELMSFSGQGTDTRGDGESEAHIERRDQGSLEWANGTAAATRGPFDYAGQDTDSSVEDEGDEDEDKHVPFPALNTWFYRERHLSEEWSYRYATQEEVLTNVYRSHSR